ncbi:MAG TPA: hypothetical protein DCM86_00350 [Verrucomicrobiales bacterium]|nr:hypothetical protein [Verrucomicrobiales bacterium]
MKHLPTVAGALLGFLFVASGLVVLLDLAPMPKMPDGSPADWFAKAFGPTGYMKFVKVMEVLGGILVAIPRVRNLGLLVLGPILINILAYQVFIMNGAGLWSPPLFLIVGLTAFLLWAGRKQFLGLISPGKE